MELDLLDKKILAVLDQDARMSEAEIGKKVRTSKQVVRYRLRRLETNQIIEKYYTILNVGQMGFDSYYIFVQLTGLNSQEEKEIYQKVLKMPSVAWLVTGIGRWDAVILCCAKTISDFNEGLTELKSLFGNHLHEYTFTTLIQGEHISYKFLKSGTSNSLKTTSKESRQSLDEIDKRILKVINQQARLPVTDISDKLSLPLHTVHYRLKQMKKDKRIQGFRPKLNIQKLGLQWHLLLISFNSVSVEKAKKFIEYCKSHRSVYYVTNTVGKYTVMLDIHVKDTEEFRNFLFDIKNEFGDIILLYESLFVFEELLVTYLPEVVTT